MQVGRSTQMRLASESVPHLYLIAAAVIQVNESASKHLKFSKDHSLNDGNSRVRNRDTGAE